MITIEEFLDIAENRIARIIAGLIVIGRSFVALAVALQTAFVLFAAQVAESWPDGARVAILIAGGLGSAALAVRRVTPVEKEDRGVLSN